VNVGFNDTPWNRIDDPRHVAPQYPVMRWQKITTECARRVTADYRRQLDATLSQIDDLREGKRTEVRVVTVYKSTIGDDVDPSWGSPGAARVSVEGNNLFARAQCEEATAHRGLCADVYHGMNGPEGTRPAAPCLGPDYTHLNQDGHTLVAHTLEQLGYSPLTR
jgi:lysophospholipase L1-like esterase